MTPMERYLELKDRLIGLDTEDDGNEIRVVVQMGVCSQASGVLDVMDALMETISHKGLHNIRIEKTGCAGFCAYEPLLTLEKKGKKLVTYCRVTPEKVGVLLSEYALRDRIIEAWTLNGKEVLL